MSDQIFSIGAADNGSDEMEVTFFRKGFTFQIEEPFAGCTETGFGQTTSIRVGLQDSLKLAYWIIEKLEKAMVDQAEK